MVGAEATAGIDPACKRCAQPLQRWAGRPFRVAWRRAYGQRIGTRAAVGIGVVLASACVGAARASVALAPAWQLQATHTATVPATVLHDAAAITIGVVDTG